ncbi:MAG: hypothetical protein IJ449_08240 [Clostridia bacterium]|nr:hypothetical protein [Clostridia bacterium]
MLIIKPVQSKELQAQLCALCGVTYRAEAVCYQAYLGEGPDDEDTFVGISQFTLGEDIGGRTCGCLYDLVNAPGVDDEEALFIMGRQTLNFMDLTGSHEAVFRPQTETSEHLIKWLGFRDAEGVWYMDLHGVFDKHKH